MKVYLIASGKKAPLAPSSLTATAVSSSRIDLAWTDNSTDEDGFKIERSLDGVNFTEITSVGAGVTTYASTGLSASTQYYYRVRAYKGALNSAYSNTANATTQALPLNRIITIDTTKTGSGSSLSNEFRLVTTGTVNYTVDWGDATSNTVTTSGTFLKSYAVGGVYDITISGRINHFVNTANANDRLKYSDIKQWGSSVTGDLNSAFYGCQNMTATATDSPNLTIATSLNRAFSLCLALTTPDFSGWSTSTITNFNNVFTSSTSFNGNVTTWNTANATTMTSMFDGCSSFNQNLSSWNVGKVTSFVNMFKGCTAMASNNSIASWNVGSGVTGTQTFQMSGFLESVNYTPSLTAYNMVRCSTISTMLRSGRSNHNYGLWDLRNTSTASLFMNNADIATIGAVTLANMYIGWASLPVQALTIAFGTAKYDASGASARAILTATRAVSVTGAIDANGNGTYTWNGTRYQNPNGWFFTVVSSQWKLRDNLANDEATSTGTFPTQNTTQPATATGWTGIESGIVVTMTGAGWTITDGGQL